MTNYEDRKNYEPVLKTAISLMQKRGHHEECKLILQGDISVVNTEFDNWNGGTYYYTVFIKISVSLYASLSKDGIESLEKALSDTLNEVTKSDSNSYFYTEISPIISSSDIDWSIIGGDQSREIMRQELQMMQDTMISVATGQCLIQVADDKYKELHLSLKQKCKLLNIQYDNGFDSLWDWYRLWSVELPTYQSRREFIYHLLSPTFNYFHDKSNDQSIVEPFVEIDDWKRIKRTLAKIKKDSVSALNEEDFQQIGHLCREVIISLAQAVFNPSIHGGTDEKGDVISTTDAMRMLGNYINVQLKGPSNEVLRSYAKATNKLANTLTHKRDADKKVMLLTVAATIALINVIGVLEDKI
ncbi:MAG: hypothetical protein IJK48_03585 [Bacteroidales bacterium]|nr:hypothetical protein [Bacteroidales bacterium]